MLEDRDPIIQYGPHLPEAYLKYIPHPKSANQTSLIIPLIGNSQVGESAVSLVHQPENRPWVVICLARLGLKAPALAWPESPGFGLA